MAQVGIQPGISTRSTECLLMKMGGAGGNDHTGEALILDIFFDELLTE
jgi:hypothetical protein